jgi:hypothetical protein
MKIKILITLIFFANIIANQAQTKYIQIGGAKGENNGAIVVSAQKDWYFGKRGTIVLGTGVRFTSFFGKNNYLITAPANLTAKPENIDSLLAPSPSISSLNLILNIGHKIGQKMEIGFNIDLAGFSFGPEGSPNFISKGNSKSVKASPTSPNVLLVGDNERGSLNSQFYGKIKITEKLGLNLAYQFLFNELTTTSKIQTAPEANDRFRSKSGQIYAGISFHF